LKDNVSLKTILEKLNLYLLPEGSATKLTLTQDNNVSQEEANHLNENWTQVLDSLKKVVEE